MIRFPIINIDEDVIKGADVALVGTLGGVEQTKNQYCAKLKMKIGQTFFIYETLNQFK